MFVVDFFDEPYNDYMSAFQQDIEFLSSIGLKEPNFLSLVKASVKLFFRQYSRSLRAVLKGLLYGVVLGTLLVFLALGVCLVSGALLVFLYSSFQVGSSSGIEGVLLWFFILFVILVSLSGFILWHCLSGFVAAEIYFHNNDAYQHKPRLSFWNGLKTLFPFYAKPILYLIPMMTFYPFLEALFDSSSNYVTAIFVGLFILILLFTVYRLYQYYFLPFDFSFGTQDLGLLKQSKQKISTKGLLALLHILAAHTLAPVLMLLLLLFPLDEYLSTTILTLFLVFLCTTLLIGFSVMTPVLIYLARNNGIEIKNTFGSKLLLIFTLVLALLEFQALGQIFTRYSHAESLGSIRPETNHYSYIQFVQRRIKQKWHPPKAKQSQQIKAKFTISNSGKLIKAEILNSSTDAKANIAALSAIAKAAPFPVFPRSMPEKSVDVEFVFDYKVIRRS